MNNPIKGIAHTAFNVKDIETALDFYCNKLGFSKIFTMELADGRKIDYIKISDTDFIELFYGKTVTAGENKGSYEHLCLEVSDIKKLREMLVQNDVSILHDIQKGLDHNFQLWVLDPDKNRIEFMQYGEGALQFENRT